MKRFSKNGFTLSELLIVVGIIAILVAVAIPIYTVQLEKANEATDMANMRAAQFLATSEYMTEYHGKNYRRYYDAGTGHMVDTAPAGYGKSDIDAAIFSNGLGTGIPCANGQQHYVIVVIDTTGNLVMTWSE